MMAPFLIEAVTAKAASHASTCECYVCRASHGDRQALEQLIVAWDLHRDEERMRRAYKERGQ